MWTGEEEKCNEEAGQDRVRESRAGQRGRVGRSKRVVNKLE